jgi:cytochrome oxidase assembly protein ShyY1|tara:strand:+ start:2535 stop:3224 length:690 start_codon:yes stop_codon:yes gene_type:complete
LNNFKSKILIFAIIFVPITISLGIWQIERANEKKLIIANYDKLLVSAPIALQKNQMLNNWQPIETTGTYEDTIVYEDNAINNGKAGFKVYHLFRNDDGTFIFIHRGFIERNLIKNNLPEVEIPTEKKSIYGTTLFKQNNTFVKNIEESDSRIIQEFNASLLIDKYPMLKDKYLHPFLFNLDIRDVNKYQPIEKPVNMTASKHIGYAIQWFGLCAALIILTIYAYRRKGE